MALATQAQCTTGTVFTSNHSHNLIVADGLCPQIAKLLPGALHELVALDARHNPLASIETELGRKRLLGQPVETLHIVAHGRPGAFQIGGQLVDSSSLLANAELLAQWRVGTIALWSCEVGADRNFVALLEELTGARVYSSSQEVGRANKISSRYWILESQSGDSSASSPFSPATIRLWPHTLAQVTVQGLYEATISYDPTGFFGEETSRIDINTTPISTANVSFSQSGAKFSGNNVLGTISYGSGSTIANALASRPIKVGGLVKGFYVWIDNPTTGSTATDKGWVLSFDNSYFNANQTINSSSDRVDKSLNAILGAQQSGVSITNVTVTEGIDTYVVFTVTNSNSGGGSARTLNSASVNFTDLTATSADFTGSTPIIEYFVGGVWTSTQPASIPGGGSLQIRVGSLANDTIPEADEIFELALNVGSGSNAADISGFGTIVDNDADSAAPIVTAAQSFNYDENRTAGATIATVLATDAVGVTQFRFANPGGTPGTSSTDGYYQIDNTGKITITAAGVAAGVANNDFETGANSFTYAIQAGDAANNWSTATNVSLNLTDLDEVAPIVTAAQSFNYDENRTAGATIATVLATDAVGVTQFRFANPGGTPGTSSTDGYYQIDNTGKITITAAGVAAGVANNDFETGANSFTYAIQAGDAANNWSTATNVSLNLTDLDEVAPIVTAAQSFNYDENRTAGATIATVLATDAVGVTQFRFANPGGTPGTSSTDGYYQIDNTGKITITAAGVAAGVANNDFETGANSFTYAIQAGDAANNWSTATNVSLNLTDLDEVAPIVTAAQSFNYDENRTAGATIATVLATDAVGVTQFRFANPGGTPGTSSTDGYYQIDNTGKITITAAGVAAGVANNDFETGANSFTYAIQAGDAANNWSTATNVSLNLTDLDEVAPIVTAAQSFNYDENRTAGATIATVLATDAVGVTQFRFANPGGTPGTSSTDGYYQIDNTGKITITAAGVAAGVANNDFETGANSFTYAIQAGDAANNWSTATNVSLNLTDLDEVAPIVTAAQSFNYDENRTAGATIATVLATDAVGVTQFRFANPGGTPGTSSTDGYYQIDNTGKITITAAGVAAGVANNDFETGANSFTYAIQAGDAANNWSTATNVSLNLTDLDEVAPIVTAAQSFNYDENRTAGATIATVLATDAVGVTQFRFANPGGTPGTSSTDGYYQIDNTGKITITAAGVAAGVANNDFETGANSFTYAIQAGDAANNWSTATNVSLNLTDLDEVAPIVTAAQSFNYDENRTAGATIATVLATDAVGVTQFRFANPGGTPGTSSTDGYYQIDNTGKITITAAGVAAGVANNDFETGANSFTYAIQAGDAANNWSTATNVSLNLTDLDEVAPIVTAAQSFNYDENRTAGATIATVLATDAVGVTQFRFANPGGTPGTSSTDGYYQIDNTGKITITAAGVAAGVANNDFETGANSFTYAIQAGDAANNWSTATNVSLNLTDLDEAIAVNNVNVNEKSPFAVFSVTGAAGQAVSLALQHDNDPNTTNATLGTDTGTQLQIFNGTNWVDYTPGSSVTLPTGGQLLVRVAINNDSDFEGPESLQLAVTPTGGNASYGNATINDDGSGNIYPDNNTGNPDLNAPKDDDQSTSVNNISVNEKSPFAVFSVTGAAGQAVSLALQHDNDPNTTNATLGTDTGTQLQIFNGTNWVDYTPGSSVTLPTGGQLLVRVAINNDSDFEGPESLQLAVTPTGGNASYGNATINDDGSGNIYPDNNTGNPDLNAPKDDDQSTSVNNISVNEKSPFAVFSVTGAAGQAVSLALQHDNDPNTTNATLGTDTGTQLQIFNGTNWVDYTPGSSVTLPTGGQLLVRVAINNDSDFEGPESLQLAVTPTGGNASYGNATINDDGSGNIYPDNNTGNPDLNAPKDDDQPTSVNNISVNEKSPFAVFSVTGAAGQAVSLALQHDNDPNTTNATLGTDTGTQLQIFNGTNWVDYTPGSSVTLPTGGQLLVRVAINNDSDFEGPESLQLAVTPTGGNASYGNATINDDGSGDYFATDNNTATPALPAGVNLDDDRPLPAPKTPTTPAPATTPSSQAPAQAPEADTDGVPSRTEDQLAEKIADSKDINGDGIIDSLQPAIATLAWIDNINFENAVSGNVDAVPKSSIITIQSVNQNGELNTGTALEAIKVIPFSDVPQGAPKSVFSEWTPIQFNIVPETAGGTLADADRGRAGTQSTVLIDNSAAQLPSTYFDRYYTYVSEEIINRYREAGLELRTLDGELLTNPSQAGWYDYTQRTPGGDGGRYVIKDGKIVGVEITFTDNSFGDDDPTANRITDPSTLVLEPDPKFDLKTDSQLIGDRITANGYPVVTLLGSPGKASAFALNGANGEALQAGTHFRVREITVDNVVSAYAIELLDADLNQAGNQAYGSYYTGQATRNQANTADGTYSVLVDGNLAGTFEIRTNALDDRERIRCLNKLSGKNSLASVLYGHRIEHKRGTNGDDVLTGTDGNNTIKGLKGSDLINGFGDRLEGSSLDVDADRNQRDVLTGGSGGDYFQLGDIVSSFYTGDGDKGYARVSDFKRGDRIVLTGSKDDYSKQSTSINGASGLGIYQGDDLVALIQGKSAQSLVFSNADQVLFI